MKALSFHPIAELVPSMSSDQFSELRRDIREHGVRVPIVLFEGMVLDGRNRATAWYDIHGNWDLPSTTFDGTPQDAVDFVRSHNITRRHLKPAQKAYFESQARAYLKPSKGRPKRNSGNFPSFPSQGKVAKAAGLDVKTIAKAGKAVKLGGDKIATALRNGHVSVDRALAIAKMPERKRDAALEDRNVPVKTIRNPKYDEHGRRVSIWAEYNRGVEAAARLVSRRGHGSEIVAEIRALKR